MRLEPVPNDPEGRLRCPFCGVTAFKEPGSGGPQLEVRQHGETSQAREPGATVWRSAPRTLFCDGGRLFPPPLQ